MLEIRELKLPGVFEICPSRLSDERGFFSETWNAASWRAAGIDRTFVQDNHSYSKVRGALRGLHYQLPPFAQDKLVRASRGAIFDVVVDIRRGSPTFAHWIGIELASDKGNQLLVPKGYAHGFVTLVPDTEVLYKVTAPFSIAHDRAIRFDDPAIGIDWPIAPSAVTLSAKDAAAPLLSQAEIFEL